MGIQMDWRESRRILTLRLASGSRMLAPTPREIEVQLAETKRRITFEGKPTEVKF